ncbi:hypothetical protein [Sphingomonas sanguinis]|nr:hypothetical protein [Sphingomonas sanguinis]
MKAMLLIPALLMASAQAHAQDKAQTSQDGVEQAIRDRNQAPDLDIRTGFAGSGVQLSTGNDNTSVTLVGARSWSRSNDRRLSFSTASAMLTAPVSDKDKKEGAFLTEGGLPKSLSLQGALTIAFSRNPPLPGTREERFRAYQKQQEQCRSLAETAEAREQCERLAYSASGGSTLYDTWNDTPVWYLGASSAIGKRNFSYLATDDFQSRDANRTEYSLSAFGGVNPGNRPLYLGLGYEYRSQYQAVSSRTRCKAASTGTQECFTGAFAQPERNIDSSVFAVTRWQWEFDLGRSGKLPVGVAVNAAYDTRDKVFGIGVPIYFISGASGLNGGVRVDWQDVEDKDERFGVRIFVGTSFKLFGN